LLGPGLRVVQVVRRVGSHETDRTRVTRSQVLDSRRTRFGSSRLLDPVSGVGLTCAQEAAEGVSFTGRSLPARPLASS
jgi:hypothetical protein